MTRSRRTTNMVAPENSNLDLNNTVESVEASVLEEVFEEMLPTPVSEVETLTVTENIEPTHTYTIIEEAPIMETPAPTNYKLEVVLSDVPIEIVNLSTGYTNTIVPKISGRVKLANSNLYRIPITNKDVVMDNFYVVKHYTKFAEYFRIISVANGKVSLVPIISGLELKSGDVIGELI